MNSVTHWFAELERIWKAKDVDAVASLLAPEFKYYESPFEEPLTNWQQVEEAWGGVKNQEILKLEITPLFVSDIEGTAHYSFEYRDAHGQNHSKKGAYYVKVNDGGKAVEFRRWWMEA